MPEKAETLTGGVLRLRSVTKAEAGRYICLARNTVGEAEESVVLKVDDPPEIMLTWNKEGGQMSDTANTLSGTVKLVVREGESLNVTCHVVAGDPAPHLSWEKYQK